MQLEAKWIKPATDMGEVCPLFGKGFTLSKNIQKATLAITARGVYEATLNGQRVGSFLMAPGWTAYEKRLQVQEYDVTRLLKKENRLEILLAKGWYLMHGAWFSQAFREIADAREGAVICRLTVTYEDNTQEIIGSDPSFQVAESGLRYCDLYDGMAFDATHLPVWDQHAVLADNQEQAMLIPQQGEPIVANERLRPVKLIVTPKGERVLDFGQNLTGTLQLTVTAQAGERVQVSFGEILDAQGNFYNENYRAAKAGYLYTCRAGEQTYMPTLTFYGFRYVRVDAFPGEVDPDAFTAVVVHSRLTQTGKIITTDPLLTQLFHNIIWGQKSNYLDIPTDCPQRDERLGWTGDAQVFVKTASYNFDVYRFFDKWLGDMRAEQTQTGAVPPVIPAVVSDLVSAAWGDAVTVCPWQMYMTYGKTEILEKMFPAMQRWVDYITASTTRPGLWTGGQHYGDWLELKAPYGSCKGETRDELVATAFYAHSTRLLCKAGSVLGKDMRKYEALYQDIVAAFEEEFRDDFHTQTEYVLPLHFGLTRKPQETAAALADMVHADGDKLQTGFVGTPYLLHVLSQYGYHELAYTLLLRKEYPSWLYPITKGATTMWEHWDGIMPDGKLWPATMNSYNHYAYGAVGDWLYEVAAGIRPAQPGFAKVHFAPVPTHRIHSFGAELQTVHGLIRSFWQHREGETVYEIITPVPATVTVKGKTYEVEPGSYQF